MGKRLVSACGLALGASAAHLLLAGAGGSPAAEQQQQRRRASAVPPVPLESNAGDASGAGAVAAVAFSSSPALDLQPLFSQSSVGAASFLGADVCTSLPLDDVGASHLVLFGDTIIGRFLPNGTRLVASMPRNSVGVFYTGRPSGNDPSFDASSPLPLSTLSHSWRVDPAHSQHVGFFSPPESAAQWYWPTAGARVRNQTDVVLQRMEVDPAGGLFPFAMAGVDVIALPDDPTGLKFADPLEWPTTLPTATVGAWVNNNMTVGNAVTFVAAEDTVYLLGGYRGPAQQWSAATLSRIGADDWHARRFDSGLRFLLVNGTWAPHWDGIGSYLQLLWSDFPGVPSECTMTYVPALAAYAIFIADTFACVVAIRLHVCMPVYVCYEYACVCMCACM
jgi:hypothetical protein